MDFELNSEQRLLQDSVRRFIEREYSFDARAALLTAGGSGIAANWSTFAENGWLMAALPEAYGGLGGSLLDTAIIAQELGRGLVVEPYLGCAVLAAQTLVAGGTEAQKAYLLPLVGAGALRIALAYSEPASRGMPEPVGLRAERDGDGYVLHGCKSLVQGAVGASLFIVSAQIPDTPGVTLLLVDADTQGLSRRALPLHDGSWVEALTFDAVQVRADAVLGEPGQGLRALRAGLAAGTVALCADLIGAMEKTIEMTAEYLKTRQQFGAPIGTFQVLQHRMADMAAELEVARSMLHAALASLANDDAPKQLKALSAAKMLICRTAKFICGQGIQLHGGIGMTEEYSVGHYYKHAVVADALLGGSDAHEAACATALQTELRAEPDTEPLEIAA
ncbi:acyl-CoA dehydrogenase family protein [Cupriavidus metallidurans]|uniref:acyl-CoA dehydrogenase family protein n=1 Tax=Cupriavidus TaxID=106589 RepID=UPI0002A1DE4C|nr:MULTISPECIES: acyl-CoA dehydrogenase family protein [Cupriavidus]EKZ95372.1 acyl-CoA dehydrogenase domain-containing protein [Cupriavidus sp. HMR-1]GMG95110.1 acyl-CoA dehydrogenase [Cupriavidus sp. TKC]